MNSTGQPKLNRRERKKQEYRDRIVTAALKLFDHRGFKATSVADIMDEADLGTGTFYNYFKTKEDMVGFLLEARLEEIHRKIAALVKAPGTGREKLCRLFHIVGNSFTDEQQARIVILMLQGKKLPTSGVNGHAVMFKDLIQELVAKAQAEGEFRPDMDTGKITSFLLGMLMYTVRQYLRGVLAAREKAPADDTAGWLSQVDTDNFREVLSDNLKMVLDGITK